MAAARANIGCQYFIGSASGPAAVSGEPRMLGQLEGAGLLDPGMTYFFCGSRGFVDSLAAGLAARGIPAGRLVYERWW